MKRINYSSAEQWEEFLKRPTINTASLENTVSTVLADVKQNGDAALKKYTLQFDKVELSSIQVSPAEVSEAYSILSNELKEAIAVAKSNIEKFHTAQIEEPKIVETRTGVKCWRKSVGIEKVGLYIPGGTAPLFSTILMLGIPAKIAGCKEIILTSPPSKDGKLHPAILYTASLVGITKIFKIGGVQAIGAMAYGTATVPKVFKIFGPGNQYVTCAKQLINKEGIAIDMPAGPSEVAIFADESCVPEFVAADLLSQAEHGEDSQVILVSDNETVIENVNKALKGQLDALPRKQTAAKALENSKAFLVKDKEEGMALLNTYAPEHLILVCKNNDVLAEKVINAGSVFLGNYSCESAGDYASGTNHTLPTNGYAKAYSGVSLDSFVKKITYQQLTQEGIQTIGSAIELMAEAEGLQAHKNAVTLRLHRR
ncbi:MAG TPA: histidinol dehydrogenase [Bacteroidia bacterium]|nr:histidinol dehydrogenase [Bacteroidia bacterium]